MKKVFSFLFLFAAVLVAVPVAFAGSTDLVSADAGGTPGNGASAYPDISSSGRHVVFYSSANNLVSGDTNGVTDVFIRDIETGAIERVSVDNAGNQGDSGSTFAKVSAYGRFVAFESTATNLVAGDTNGRFDVFVRDTETGTTERVSVASDGSQGDWGGRTPSISGDGQLVTFYTLSSNLVTNNRGQVFVRDRATGITTLVSVAIGGGQGNESSHSSVISANGRFVAFMSYATDLVAGDTNGQGDLFVRDLETGTTERVNVASDGTQANGNTWTAPAISADGRIVAFMSAASNLVADDTNGKRDIFVHDRETGITERVSVASDGTEANDSSDHKALSADGRYVAIYSGANNLVANDTNADGDVFFHDRNTLQTWRVSIADDGSQANNFSAYPAVSADGRRVVFTSGATNLGPSDTNAANDIYVHEQCACP